METFSALLVICAGNSPVTGEFPSQRPVMRSFDVFFDLRLNKRLSKQSLDWWFETPSCSLWRHSNNFFWVQRLNKVSALSLSFMFNTVLYRPRHIDSQWYTCKCKTEWYQTTTKRNRALTCWSLNKNLQHAFASTKICILIVFWFKFKSKLFLSARSTLI